MLFAFNELYLELLKGLTMHYTDIPSSVRKPLVTVLGGFLAFIGAVFILVPGPAFLFLPIGLAILSLEYPLAKVWLKKSQRLMKQGAEKLDRLIAKLKR